LHQFDCLILCTLNAFASAGQAELVRQALRLGIPTIVVALRMPYDLAVFPEAPTFVCAYSIQEPSMQALAQALVGKIEFQGCLPVSIAGLYPAGHGR
jgi:beta-N-acetylhexosaminidase